MRSIKGSSSRKAGVEIQAYNHGRPGTREQIKCLVDSGVKKTLIREEDWERLRMPESGGRKLNLKRNKTMFRMYRMGSKLEIVGRTKCSIQAKCGERIRTVIYIVRGAEELLLGLKA